MLIISGMRKMKVILSGIINITMTRDHDNIVPCIDSKKVTDLQVLDII